MQAVRTIVWVILAVLLTVFAVANSQVVAVSVWPGYVAELPLSILIILVFLAGFLPIFLMHVSNRWLMRRQIEAQKQTITSMKSNEARAPVVTETPPVPAPAADPML